jgi:hypothetical protein
VKRIFLIALLLSACGPRSKSDEAFGRDASQSTLDLLVPACRDGQQFLVTPYQGPSQVVVRRTHIDGSGYSCKIVNTAAAVREEWEQ